MEGESYLEGLRRYYRENKVMVKKFARDIHYHGVRYLMSQPGFDSRYIEMMGFYEVCKDDIESDDIPEGLKEDARTQMKKMDNLIIKIGNTGYTPPPTRVIPTTQSYTLPPFPPGLPPRNEDDDDRILSLSDDEDGMQELRLSDLGGGTKRKRRQTRKTNNKKSQTKRRKTNNKKSQTKRRKTNK